MPVIVKVLVALGVILLTNRLCGKLILAAAAGTLVLALWSGHSASGIASISWTRFSAADNVRLAIWLRGPQSDGRIHELFEKLGLSELKNKRPTQLSVGQQQRIASGLLRKAEG